jgi:23S rRNA pseudouridine1911/1915/1917 synthase
VPKQGLQVLFEDNHCIAVIKPAGVVTTHYQGKEETLDRAVKQYLREKYHKPGNVFLGVVHRLDRLVSGVLLFARTSKAAGRISEQFRDGTVEKRYCAVVEGRPRESEGTLEDWLLKDRETGQVDTVDPTEPGSRRAVLRYQQVGEPPASAVVGRTSVLNIELQTGRTHQIRVQLASRGMPVYGDKKYGAARSFPDGIALHAAALAFIHPIRQERIRLTSPFPEFWNSYFGFEFGPAAPVK